MLRLALALALVGFVLPALAHEWYDPWCCNGQDCRPIDAERVTARPDGYHVEGYDRVVPYSEARPSGDTDYHVCEIPAGHIRCFYVPPGGV